jgi:hypothetical protein
MPNCSKQGVVSAGKRNCLNRFVVAGGFVVYFEMDCNVPHFFQIKKTLMSYSRMFNKCDGFFNGFLGKNRDKVKKRLTFAP